MGEPLKAYLASFVPDSFVEFATTGGLVVFVTVIRVNQIVCFVIFSKKIYIYKGLTAPELLIMKRREEFIKRRNYIVALYQTDFNFFP